jgi:hypothetical protein
MLFRYRIFAGCRTVLRLLVQRGTGLDFRKGRTQGVPNEKKNQPADYSFHGGPPGTSRLMILPICFCPVTYFPAHWSAGLMKMHFMEPGGGRGESPRRIPSTDAALKRRSFTVRLSSWLFRSL